MRLSTTAISSVTSYTKMSEPTTPPSPSNLNTKKFEGDGLSFKGKLIGMEDLHADRDEKICLDAMFKLKAVVKARGEHKQRIQLNLTMNAVNIIDDTTKAPVVSHAIERISFVVIDPRDTRAFGYIFNTTDDRHQFWAVKTERAAAASVLALKELFEIAFEQFTNAEKSKGTSNPTSAPTQESSTNAVEQSASSSSPPTATTTPSLIDDFWGSTPATSTPVVTTSLPPPPPPLTATTNDNLWDFNAEPLPVIPPPAPKPVDPLADLFGDLELTQTTLPPPLPNTNTLLNNFNSTPQTQTGTYPPRMAPPPPTTQPQQRSLSPVSPPSSTNPFSDFDFLDNLSSGTTAPRPTKESFFPPVQPPKTIQQLQMENSHS